MARAGVEYSIVLDNVAVASVRGIHGSLIGRGAQVQSSSENAQHRLVIGDHTRVEIMA